MNNGKRSLQSENPDVNRNTKKRRKNVTTLEDVRHGFMSLNPNSTPLGEITNSTYSQSKDARTHRLEIRRMKKSCGKVVKRPDVTAPSTLNPIATRIDSQSSIILNPQSQAEGSSLGNNDATPQTTTLGSTGFQSQTSQNHDPHSHVKDKTMYPPKKIAKRDFPKSHFPGSSVGKKGDVPSQSYANPISTALHSQTSQILNPHSQVKEANIQVNSTPQTSIPPKKRADGETRNCKIGGSFVKSSDAFEVILLQIPYLLENNAKQNNFFTVAVKLKQTFWLIQQSIFHTLQRKWLNQQILLKLIQMSQILVLNYGIALAAMTMTTNLTQIHLRMIMLKRIERQARINMVANRFAQVFGCLTNKDSPVVDVPVGVTIQGTIRDAFPKSFETIMNEGEWFGITNFKLEHSFGRVRMTKNRYNVILSEKSIIFKSEPTTYCNYYAFKPFGSIIRGLAHPMYCIDLYGALVGVGSLETYVLQGDGVGDNSLDNKLVFSLINPEYVLQITLQLL
ncbi:unnamed protein product [Brassica napus]|uniref:(rape) hypothetical protein n=1 Tax=Brassica napus TaxID=3708 RepID=A0A816JS32_BRANA|nr:unnamed protein product [Brassica napus]